MKKVCYGCKNRHIGCHSACQEYISEKAEHDRKQAVIRKALNEQHEADSVIKAAIARENKKKNGGR